MSFSEQFAFRFSERLDNEMTVVNEEGVVAKSAGSNGAAKATGGATTIESVADILERELQNVIVDWLARVEEEPDLKSIPLSFEERTGHLPHLLHDVIKRLRLDAGTKAPISKAAAEHGDLRRKQGYTVAMAVQESRLLQVTIFETLRKNTNNLEFSKLLPDVVTIADEVDAQLKEQMLRFMAADATKLPKGK
jgi:RsbT co-antagonist protein rsbRD N-terminal domain